MNIKKLFLTTILFIILHFAFWILYLPKVYAQSLSLSISPTLTELIIKPGKTVSQQIKITNNGDPTVITPQIVPFSLNPDDGTLQTGKESPDNSSSSWFKSLSPDIALDKPFFLNTGQTISLILSINIPQNAQTSDYYFYLKFLAHPPNPSSTSAADVEGSIATNILISVTNSSSLDKNAEISRFQTPYLLDSFDGLDVAVEIKNTGSVFFKPIGKMTLKGILLQSEYNIIPQNILTGGKKILLTDQALSPTGTLPRDKSLHLEGFFFGPYSLTTDFKLDGTNIEIKKTVRFFGFPYKLTSLILLIFLLYKFAKAKFKR